MAIFERQFFEYLNNITRYLKTQPLNLGGSHYSGGGIGGPPGGFIGYLPQSRVAYDLSELATLDTTGSGVNYSGASIIDNLNHIRYRVQTLEQGFSGVTVMDTGVTVASGITILNFENADVEYVAPDRVNITITVEQYDKYVPSGIYGENLSPQIGASGTSHFYVNNSIFSNSLRVYYNGVRQSSNFHTLDTNRRGFTTTYTTVSGDSMAVDYDILVNDTATVISSGVSLAYLEANYYNKTEVDAIAIAKSDVGHTHVEADITDLSHDADFIQGIPVSTSGPSVGFTLIYDGAEYSPTSISASIKTIYQQYLFTIEGVMSDAGAGVKPIRIYAHDTNGTATIDEVFLSLNTPPASTAVQVDVLKNGASIFSAPEYVQIASGDYTAMRDSAFASNTFVKDDYFKIELVQTDTTASDLTVHVRFHWETD